MLNQYGRIINATSLNGPDENFKDWNTDHCEERNGSKYGI
jgi:hypothetical protein